MSLIILSKDGTTPSEVLLKNAVNLNPHGWGVMHAENNAVHVVKGFNLDTLLSNIQKRAGKPFMVHINRLSAKSEPSIVNCQPDEIMTGLWMVQDGFVSDFEDKDFDRSRTSNFCTAIKDFMMEFPAWCKNSTNLAGYLKRWMDTDCMAALLRASGEFIVVNPSAWFEYEGVLLSDLECTPEYIQAAIEAAKKKKNTTFSPSPGQNSVPTYKPCAVPGIKAPTLVDPHDSRTPKAPRLLLPDHAAARKCEWCPKVTKELYIEPDDKDNVCKECALLNEALSGNSITSPEMNRAEVPPNGTTSNHTNLTKCGYCSVWVTYLKWYDGIEACTHCYDTAVKTEAAHKEILLSEEESYGHMWG